MGWPRTNMDSGSSHLRFALKSSIKGKIESALEKCWWWNWAMIPRGLWLHSVYLGLGLRISVIIKNKIIKIIIKWSLLLIVFLNDKGIFSPFCRHLGNQGVKIRRNLREFVDTVKATQSVCYRENFWQRCKAGEISFYFHWTRHANDLFAG